MSHILDRQTKFSSQPSIEYPDIMKTTPAVALGAAKEDDVVAKLATNVAWTARPWSINQHLAINFTMIAIWLAEYVIDDECVEYFLHRAIVGRIPPHKV